MSSALVKEFLCKISQTPALKSNLLLTIQVNQNKIYTDAILAAPTL